jgi:curved DNA-binding protein CbpA
MVLMADPYKALGLGHDATHIEIKRAYRNLARKCHPDALARARAGEKDIEEATAKFAAISAAYAILSDSIKKKQYDHIYKFGGFDEQVASSPPPGRRHGSGPAPKRHNSGGSDFVRSNSHHHQQQQQQQKGIGYAIPDPFTFIMSQGKVRGRSVAGITIPSRFNMVHSGGGGLRLSFSSGQIRKTPSGSLEFTSKTTQFVGGKKLSRSETTTLHQDGTKEVIIEGDDYVERRVTAVPKRKRRPSKDEDDLTRSVSPENEVPWYMNAWNGVRDSVQMCTTGHCGTISVR